MRTFARDLPARALCLLTGIPLEDHDRFVAWIDILEVQLAGPRLVSIGREESERVLRAQREMTAYCRDVVQQRRLAPRDDLVSALAAEIGDEFDETAIVTLISDLIFAGNDTTRNALGLMVMTLAEHPDSWEAVARDPSLAASVVEEVLRLQSPAPGPVRCVRGRLSYRDTTFEAGEVVLLSIWSANRDESFWGEDAGAFDPEREHAGEHVTFGHGPHFCLGAGLAREEMRAALVALTASIKDVRVLEVPEMHPPGSIYGPVELFIDFARR
jgi:cytochrome P450